MSWKIEKIERLIGGYGNLPTMLNWMLLGTARGILKAIATYSNTYAMVLVLVKWM